jgi:hypothetical protein
MLRAGLSSYPRTGQFKVAIKIWRFAWNPAKMPLHPNAVLKNTFVFVPAHLLPSDFNYADLRVCFYISSKSLP